jgi:adenylate kinase family enzyme
LGNEYKHKMQELKDKMKEEAEALEKKTKPKKVANKNDKNPEPVVERVFNPRIPDEMLYKILKQRLNENDCKNKGYIIDGYPRNFINCQHIFFDETNTEEPLNKEILPAVVFLLDHYTDDFLKNRIKTHVDPSLLTGPHYSDEGIARRLKTYKELNESVKGDPKLVDFFHKHEIDVEVLDCKQSERELVEHCKGLIEKVLFE